MISYSEFYSSSSKLIAVFAFDGSREISHFRSARGNVKDPVQVFSACIFSIASLRLLVFRYDISHQEGRFIQIFGITRLLNRELTEFLSMQEL